LARRLCEKTDNRQPVFLEVLAAAYAEDGQFERATHVAGQALALARRHGLAELEADLKRRMDGYRRGEPDRRPIP
jgi:hypothetical protein